MPTAFITGVAGFIGSHLAERLLSSGWTVSGIDNLAHGHRAHLADFRRNPRFSFERGDCRDEALMRRHIRKADVVVHLAAFKIPRYGGRVETLHVNHDSAEVAVRLASRIGSGRFVFASTSEVYGKNPNQPFHEFSDVVIGPPIVARWAYAVSKIMSEHLIWGYMEEGRIDPVVLRFFGCYGPREHRSWQGGPFAAMIENALAGKPIDLHGDGRQTRTFVYASDLVRGIELAMTKPRARGQAWNLGSDEEISMKDLAAMLWSLCRPGTKPRFRYVPYRNFSTRYEDVRRRAPDNSAARRTLGFRSTVNLRDGAEKTVAWHRSVFGRTLR